ncbi:amidohydrolase 2 [Halothermothrix orenii H 168]|uniref:Amidohydrolase 2 n=1 Tax=Halothermothrix orenii (strain H 168 / OCM 544 / DSM 9562) TaxID=373903 RepID=B8CXX4_HALOH|nr:amidohydrolase 2 [Halothermothrix orenii H 168]
MVFFSAVRRSTPERIIRDMKLNNISKSVVLQLNTPECDSSEDIAEVIPKYDELITFGNIHPYDRELSLKIERNLNFGVKGWKIAPHVIDIDIDDAKTIQLLKLLAQTKLPIISCSGLAFPENRIKKLPGKIRKNLETQNINKFYKVLKEIPNVPFIFAHAGMYQTKELVKLMKLYPNTYVEISTQPPAKIRLLLDEIGSERILYGTDYPAFNHSFSIVSVLRATKDETERKNIFYNNAKKLLKI